MRHSLAAARLLLQALALSIILVLPSPPAHANSTEISQLHLERTEEGVFLSASLKFDLPPVVEDALLKGVAMFFVLEADLLRDRWYWYDKKLVTARRNMRLAYQPLTRRWRLNVTSGAAESTGLGVSLNQTFDSLSDALAAVQRVSRWKIAEASDVEPDVRHNVDFRFRLDVSQLPRPFQIGAVGQSDWNLSASKNQRLVMEGERP